MSSLISITATVAAVSMAVSFAEKKKADTRKKEAQAEADRKMEDARAALEVNYADELSIAKEPYERQREAMLVQGAQIMEQAVESERGGGASAGRVLAAQQEGQGQVRDKQSQDLFNLEAAQAEEDSRLRDINVDMDLGQIAGAQQAAAEAQEASNMHKQQAIQSGIQLAGSLASLGAGKLGPKTAGVRAVNKAERIAGRQGTTLNAKADATFSGSSNTLPIHDWTGGGVGTPNWTGPGTPVAGPENMSWSSELGIPQAEWDVMKDIQKRDWWIQNQTATNNFL